jgi:hypothetical protein
MKKLNNMEPGKFIELVQEICHQQNRNTRINKKEKYQHKPISP